MTVFKERDKYTKYKILTLLQDLTARYGYESKISKLIAQRMMLSGDLLAEADRLRESIAYVTFYLKNNQQEVVVQIVPFMTFATFVSNVGGLMGLWLGLSAISIMQFLEKTVASTIVFRHTVRRPIKKPKDPESPKKPTSKASLNYPRDSDKEVALKSKRGSMPTVQ